MVQITGIKVNKPKQIRDINLPSPSSGFDTVGLFDFVLREKPVV